MSRTHNRLLQEHPRVAERAVSLAHRGFESRGKLLERIDAAHSAPATTGDSLGEHGEPDVLGLRDECVDVVGRLGRSQHGNTCGDRVLLRRDLVPRHLESARIRPDEGDAVRRGLRREVGVLREEAVAGVDRVRTRFDGDANDLVDVEVGPHGVTFFADPVGLVGLQPVQRVPVLVREHRDGPCAELIGGTERADRDLSAIGYQDLLEHVPPQAAR